jgi:thiol:disulfide interchange protein
MNFLRITYLAFVVGFVCSCGKAKEPTKKTGTSIEWITATNALEYYTAETPDRPVVALFTSDWDLVGELFKKHIEVHKDSLFPDNTPKFIVYDCTKDDSIGQEQLTDAGVRYRPVLFVSYGGGWRHTQLPNDFLEDPNAEDDYLREFTRVIAATKKKQNKPDMATPRKPSDQI